MLQDTKVCNKCYIEKPVTEYHRRTISSGKQSCSHWCKDCIREKSKQRYALKKEHINSVNRVWRSNNKQYYRNRYEQNKELYLSWLRQWAYDNPGKHKERSRKRRVRSKNAFVAWANKEKIDSIYAMSKFLTEIVGVPYHVDHIIPLQGKHVSGLHVENNLAIIRADLNLSKGNKYEIG